MTPVDLDTGMSMQQKDYGSSADVSVEPRAFSKLFGDKGSTIMPMYAPHTRSPDMVRKILKYQDPATSKEERAALLASEPELRVEVLVPLSEKEKASVSGAAPAAQGKSPEDEKAAAQARWAVFAKDARKKLQMVSDNIQKKTKAAPFTLKPQGLPYVDLMAILKAANMGGEARSLADLYKRVDTLLKTSREYLEGKWTINPIDVQKLPPELRGAVKK